jgi:hypothetical protein
MCHFVAGIVEVTGSISSFIGNIAMGWTIEETGEEKNTRGNTNHVNTHRQGALSSDQRMSKARMQP